MSLSGATINTGNSGAGSVGGSSPSPVAMTTLTNRRNRLNLTLPTTALPGSSSHSSIISACSLSSQPKDSAVATSKSSNTSMSGPATTTAAIHPVCEATDTRLIPGRRLHLQHPPMKLAPAHHGPVNDVRASGLLLTGHVDSPEAHCMTGSHTSAFDTALCSGNLPPSASILAAAMSSDIAGAGDTLSNSDLNQLYLFLPLNSCPRPKRLLLALLSESSSLPMKYAKIFSILLFLSPVDRISLKESAHGLPILPVSGVFK
ncbi:unnamed protein product [Protopolystoma xenopodis]|uniref:Uncharacterized protein n=1 Tax=Protopolystoma xenopodis TaxID=117903 RepID=A0A448XGE7_9PLAT|nr:unnamed protein product [Protopolystoma xenopodis]